MEGGEPMQELRLPADDLVGVDAEFRTDLGDVLPPLIAYLLSLSAASQAVRAHTVSRIFSELVLHGREACSILSFPQHLTQI